TCQYCGKKFPSEDLTFDHVIPVARGGQKRWDNIVAACFRCNHRKGGRTPEEAGVRLIRPPSEPHWLPAIHVTFKLKSTPESWRAYLYWNIELDIEDDAAGNNSIAGHRCHDHQRYASAQG